jgi:hypothetical protein
MTRIPGWYVHDFKYSPHTREDDPKGNIEKFDM